MEFDIKCALIENILGQYFYKSLKPSIKLWIDKKDQKLDSWDVLVKKAIRAKAKAKIQSFANRNID